MRHELFGDTGTDWSKTIIIGGAPVVCELLASEDATSSQLDALVPFVERSSQFDISARAALAEDEDGLSFYLEHHLAEFSDEQVMRNFGTANRAEVTRERALARLQLVRIGLFPGESDAAVFDYSISLTDTQYVLAVFFNASGEISSIAMES